MIGVSTSLANISILRRFNTWYSVADGNFSDPGIWMSNGKKKHDYPQPGDDVYMDHVVTIDNNGYTIRNLYVSGTLAFSLAGGSSLTVNGDLQIAGVLDMSATAICTLTLLGVNNFVTGFITPGSRSTISYARLGDQDIVYLPYQNLELSGSGNKNVVADLTIKGTTSIGGTATMLKKTFAGKLTFGGQLLDETADGILDNTINADIEFQGGITLDGRHLTLKLGTGNLYFNGTQTVLIGGGIAYNNYNAILVKGGSVVTIPTNSTPFIVNGNFNGETSSSTLNISGTFYLGTAAEPMSTGIYNYNFTSTSNIGYIFNGDYTLPHGSYSGLTIFGTGTKTLGSDTTVTTLTIDNSGSLELSSFDFTVTGITNYGIGSLTKNSSTGGTLFVGQVNLSVSGTSSLFEFNNPCVLEFQNGLITDNRTIAITMVSGCLVKFTTNNQNIFIGGNSSLIIDADILVSGSIIVTNQGSGFGITGTLNGDNISSIFDNRTLFNYENHQQPMQTGSLLCNSALNTFNYAGTVNQDVTQGTYRNLELSGNGVKKLLGNVSVVNTYTLSSPAALDANGFSLTNP